ncbi:MAG: hypothetical protein IT378_15870 [Sandaracinaceae bacterium]|nr:hypothetical protein [Sandaracinaceae bacterium]MCC6875785.1 hypothetical protein [Sandaracinaceae bacterium]
MSDESFLYLVYKRFLAVFFSVLPGLLMVIGLPAISMVVLDLIGVPFGWTLGISAFVMFLSFIGSIFLGLLIQDKMLPHEPHG